MRLSPPAFSIRKRLRAGFRAEMPEIVRSGITIGPSSVMIYGQSGGGSKVTCLMPSAAGLFHRGIAQSGGGGNIPGIEQSRELARQLMKELGLRPNDLASLQKMDWATLDTGQHR